MEEDKENKESIDKYVSPRWAKVTQNRNGTQFNGLLNKLTPDNSGKLSVLITQNLKTENSMEQLINMIIEKAQLEHSFGNMYAQLCAMILKQLKETNLVVDEKRGDHIFKRILVSQCQFYFEVDKNSEMSEILQIADKETQNEKILKVKKKNSGHLKFLGELYREGILTKYMMNYCLETLFGVWELEEPNEEKIEDLCILMTVIGHQLELESSLNTRKDKGKSLKVFYKYIRHFNELSRKSSLSSRIRFMCQDLVDMSSNNWQPRLKRETPKTKEEIHVWAMKEELEKVLLGPQESYMKIMARFRQESHTMKPFYAIGIKGDATGGFIVSGHFEGFEDEFLEIPLNTYRVSLIKSPNKPGIGQGFQGKGKGKGGQGFQGKGKGKGKGGQGFQGKGKGKGKGGQGKGKYNGMGLGMRPSQQDN